MGKTNIACVLDKPQKVVDTKLRTILPALLPCDDDSRSPRVTNHEKWNVELPTITDVDRRLFFVRSLKSVNATCTWYRRRKLFSHRGEISEASSPFPFFVRSIGIDSFLSDSPKSKLNTLFVRDLT